MPMAMVSMTRWIRVDSDGDGNADYVDIDSDNDGIPDTIEADLDVLADGDSDQINDVYDVNATMGADLDGDGVDDAIAPTDTDGDMAPDYIDLDSDNDSLLDVAEAGGQDFDGDGIILEPALNEGSLTMPIDSDGDGTGDWREVDSDNDGTNDIVGSQFESDDIDGDGIVDIAADADGDGISDAIDQFDGFGSARDSDRDGILDDNEGTGDSDGDGVPDAQDSDSDNDGIPDAIEAGPNPGSPVDTDADGLPDYRDTDSDGDGIGDDLEGTADANGNGIPDYIDSGGTLETAVKGIGGGSLGIWSLLVLALLVISRRNVATAVAPLFLAGFILFILPAERGYADSLCGHYTDPGDDRYFYLGDDPDLDRAGFDNCWYAGLGWGYSYVSPDEEANNFLHDTSENHDSGLQVFLGKQLSPHWWLELKYADLGEAGITNRNPAVAAAFPNAAITYAVPSLMAGYQWRVQKNLKPFLKFGLSAISNDATGGPVPFEKQTSVQLAFGGGLKYDFGRNRWFVRGDFDWYDRDAWYAGASVGLFFGHDAEDRPAVVPVVDSDNDGVMDPDDICPGTAAGAEVDGSGCLVIKDSDGDGVVDSSDACPDTPAGTRVNQRGCPQSTRTEMVY